MFVDGPGALCCAADNDSLLRIVLELALIKALVRYCVKEGLPLIRIHDGLSVYRAVWVPSLALVPAPTFILRWPLHGVRSS